MEAGTKKQNVGGDRVSDLAVYVVLKDSQCLSVQRLMPVAVRAAVHGPELQNLFWENNKCWSLVGVELSAVL